MYVDKKLSGVACVQTLSRLNRTTAGKEETFVLDFENSAEDIEKGFQPFYDRVTLSKETDPNQLYNIRTDLDKFAIHTAADLETFAKQWFAAVVFPSADPSKAVVSISHSTLHVDKRFF